MFQNAKTTRMQGDIGLSAAVYQYTKLGYFASVPLTDNCSYDLIVDTNNGLKTVQVKSSKSKRNGNFIVQVGRVRSNRTKNAIHRFDSSECDLLFVATSDENFYSIPSCDIKVGRELTIDSRFDQYVL